MPRRPGSRFPRGLRRTGLAAAVVLLALVLADRTGLFGRGGESDLAVYDGKTFTVTHSVDGDTFAIGEKDRLRGKGTTTIRLWGVDTPETVKPNTPTQRFGKEASDFTKGLTAGKAVRLELVANRDTRDKYQRLLAYVYLPDGRMLNRLLIEEGYGYADPRFDHPFDTQFASAMAKAKRQKLGLWTDFRESDLPDYLQPRRRPYE